MPLENEIVATASEPIVDMMTGAASKVAVVMVNSGFDADSVVPDGDTTIVQEPAAIIADKSVSISPTPYDRYRDKLIATD